MLSYSALRYFVHRYNSQAAQSCLFRWSIISERDSLSGSFINKHVQDNARETLALSWNSIWYRHALCPSRSPDTIVLWNNFATIKVLQWLAEYTQKILMCKSLLLKSLSNLYLMFSRSHYIEVIKIPVDWFMSACANWNMRCNSRIYLTGIIWL